MNENEKTDVSTVTDEKKLLSVLGLSARSGNMIFGVPQICEMLGGKRKKGKYPLIVFEASDTSDNTHKKISDKCAFYGVRRIRLATDGATLAHSLGKSAVLAAVALTDENLCKLAEQNIKA